ncbi:hypothetical protein EDD16DRAFT_1522917 [Pisolithus croceorrhizus]|nr:hypothetical protein EDD16DRAFT_1522917 [Pisolithus croceorrhizus]KAI6122984.1 hypothetical protein EV401DRAFT_1887031 [Pisolithus croceorrhizus]KAI6148208.1 hypothetical protein EDD17DRAFT_1514277 [Pisolithus thermaeus]
MDPIPTMISEVELLNEKHLEAKKEHDWAHERLCKVTKSLIGKEEEYNKATKLLLQSEIQVNQLRERLGCESNCRSLQMELMGRAQEIKRHIEQHNCPVKFIDKVTFYYLEQMHKSHCALSMQLQNVMVLLLSCILDLSISWCPICCAPHPQVAIARYDKSQVPSAIPFICNVSVDETISNLFSAFASALDVLNLMTQNDPRVTQWTKEFAQDDGSEVKAY